MGRTTLTDEADFVIVGTGAGGATAGRVLSEAGFAVLFVEEGPLLDSSTRPRDFLNASKYLRDMGSQTTAGATPMPLLQGVLVGGSTAVNSGIIWRTPEDVIDSWTGEHGLGELLVPSDLRRVFEVLERELDVARTSEAVFGGNGWKMAEACERLGLPGQPMMRNAAGCRGRGRCLQGCPAGDRRSMESSYIPFALERGARLHPECRVERVVLRGGVATGVRGVRTKDGVPFFFRGRMGTIVSAGVVHTPGILQRSGLRGEVGKGFQSHPGCAVVGRFPDVVGMSYGASQGYEVPMRHRGYKIESLSLPGELLATRIPGAGALWEERVRSLGHFAQWCVQVRMGARGTVRRGWGGRPAVHFEPTRRDLAVTLEAVALICRMMFSAGATEVYPGLGGAPSVLRTVGEVEHLERLPLRRGNFRLVGSHLFGTARAGDNARTSVVSPRLAVHGVRGLHVMDASVLPTNIGVNPQHTIMGLCFLAAEKLAQDGSLRATG